MTKMISPFTGGKVELHSEDRTATFRKEKFGYKHQYYRCVDTGEIFTTTELDTVNMMQIYNQYRVKFGIPFADEIKEVRKQYGLSAKRMSAILGFGENMYRLYENGEIPNVANGKTLKAIQNPVVFQRYVEDSKNMLSNDEFESIIAKIQESSTCDLISDFAIFSFVFGGVNRGEMNGYAPQSMSRLKNTMLFFIEKFGGVFYTKMNKLLFYADFVSYRDCGQAITGLSYKAITYGPVPSDWNAAYGMIDDIETEEVEYPNGNVGQRLVSTMPYDRASLSEEQVKVLERVFHAFEKDTAVSISDKSHKEDAWKENLDGHQMINFKYAFDIKAI